MVDVGAEEYHLLGALRVTAGDSRDRIPRVAAHDVLDFSLEGNRCAGRRVLQGGVSGGVERHARGPSAGRLHADGARSDSRQRPRLRPNRTAAVWPGQQQRRRTHRLGHVSGELGKKKRRAGWNSRPLLVARQRTGDARSRHARDRDFLAMDVAAAAG